VLAVCGTNGIVSTAISIGMGGKRSWPSRFFSASHVSHLCSLLVSNLGVDACRYSEEGTNTSWERAFRSHCTCLVATLLLLPGSLLPHSLPVPTSSLLFPPPGYTTSIYHHPSLLTCAALVSTRVHASRSLFRSLVSYVLNQSRPLLTRNRCHRHPSGLHLRRICDFLVCLHLQDPSSS
jgi:hypothetical protein